jgi:hypothetical protein
MPHEEPVISHEEPIIDDTAAQHGAAQDTAVHARETSVYAPPPDDEPPAHQQTEGQDEWLEDPEELPRRPRRRLLGTGGNRIFLALLGVLLTACGFIGGVLVEKGQTTSSSSSPSAAAGIASRFRALREGTSSTGTSSTSSSSALGSSSGFTRPTAGTVAYLAGSTLYVTNSEGNTVKVTTSPGTSVTKTVKATVKGIHPGETVTITGATGANGTVSAESISVGSSSGGLAALFAGAGGTGAGRGATGGAGGGEPSLFGGG